MQSELRSSTKRQEQGQEVQTARMDAMGYRMAEIKDLKAQREVRMEAQMQEVCTQIQAMGSLLKNIQPQPTGSNIKYLPLEDTSSKTLECRCLNPQRTSPSNPRRMYQAW